MIVHSDLALFLMACAGAAGCDRGAATGPMVESDQVLATKEGVVTFHAPDVKSLDAWHGHQFKVDGLPLLATESVSFAQLKQHVGKRVVVRGNHYEGTPFDQRNPPNDEPGPANLEGEDPIIMRGWGLRVHRIQVVKNEDE